MRPSRPRQFSAPLSQVTIHGSVAPLQQFDAIARPSTSARPVQQKRRHDHADLSSAAAACSLLATGRRRASDASAPPRPSAPRCSTSSPPAAPSPAMPSGSPATTVRSRRWRRPRRRARSRSSIGSRSAAPAAACSASTLPDLGIFGGDDDEGEDGAGVNEINSTILARSAPARTGGWCIRLADNSVWVQTDGRPGLCRAPARRSASGAGALGSFIANIDDRAGIRVVRQR